jgi:hypothetical protein
VILGAAHLRATGRPRRAAVPSYLVATISRYQRRIGGQPSSLKELLRTRDWPVQVGGGARQRFAAGGGPGSSLLRGRRGSRWPVQISDVPPPGLAGDGKPEQRELE